MSEEISEAKIKWFKEQNFKITLFPEKTVKKFRDPYELEKFLEEELRFWHFLPCVLNSYRELHKAFIRFKSDDPNLSSLWMAYLQSIFEKLRSAKEKINHGDILKKDGSIILFSQTIIAQRIQSLDKRFNTSTILAFLNFIYNRDALSLEDFDNFVGAIEAYIFSDEETHFRTYLEDERRSFSELFSEINSLYERTTGLEIERAERIESLFEKSRIRLTDLEESVKNRLEISAKTLSDVEQGFRKSVSDNEELLTKTISKYTTELENTKRRFQEENALSKPVKYWQEINRLNQRIGWRFFRYTVGVSAASLFCLMVILYKWPPSWFDSDGWDLNTIKGSLVLLTITSIVAYTIHLTAKFSISSFHLARDANERRQLTYVYLSLIKEGAIPKEEQKIVLQSLFSRADTGLLKGEHAPTMPGIGALFNQEQ